MIKLLLKLFEELRKIKKSNYEQIIKYTVYEHISIKLIPLNLS